MLMTAFLRKEPFKLSDSFDYNPYMGRSIKANWKKSYGPYGVSTTGPNIPCTVQKKKQ